jgi:NAD(P)-dependent dehydrogenase (short-subunit alcohol dehydrogenase family)
MNQNAYYQDKICIVTGANSGIGYALSETPSTEGQRSTWQDATQRRLRKLLSNS